MKQIKSLIPNFIRQGISPLMRLYHQTTFYRNQVTQLGGRLSGYKLKGGKLRGFLDGTYENELCNIIEKNVRIGMTCVDIGAHLGYITLLFAKLSGESGCVIAFEAFPSNAKYIQQNIEMNHLGHYVKVENIAISSNQTPTVTLHPGRMRSMAEWKIDTHNLSSGVVVPATSLDDYFQQGQLVDFIKMDIEGAETLAIPYMKRILQESRPLLCIEFHNDSAWKTRQILIDAKYQLYDIQKRQWINSSDENRVYHCFIVPEEKAQVINL